MSVNVYNIEQSHFEELLCGLRNYCQLNFEQSVPTMNKTPVTINYQKLLGFYGCENSNSETPKELSELEELVVTSGKIEFEVVTLNDLEQNKFELPYEKRFTSQKAVKAGIQDGIKIFRKKTEHDNPVLVLLNTDEHSNITQQYVQGLKSSLDVDENKDYCLVLGNKKYDENKAIKERRIERGE